MKLKWFRVREFQSIKDSGQIDVTDIACLVGKNEAGKSALLKALYRLNAMIKTEGSFSVTHDYPRMQVEDYRIAVEKKKRSPAVPIEACYELDYELPDIEKVFGPNCIVDKTFILTKSYENKRAFILRTDTSEALKYLIEEADLSPQVREALKNVPYSAKELLAVLQSSEQTAAIQKTSAVISKILELSFSKYVYDTYINDYEPAYLYFDEYYQLSGHENVEALIQRAAANQLKPSDHPMLGLIRLARLELNEMLNVGSTVELRNRLEGASNHLTRQVLKYWSQNKHLRMNFDVRQARPQDPPGMQSGTNIWGGVYDGRHGVTTELGSRSRGFVWFFSFLAWYSDVKREGSNVILLLDEPGLTLHAKAQYDLLRYFETELKGEHQLIYSTHSPFMIDPAHFERVRIVQDRSIDSQDGIDAEDEGSRVLTDVFGATEDSLFPLQGALGYELHQTLFVGPFSLVVEGSADLLYLQSMSALLEEEGRTGLDQRWTITPVGGAAKVPTFVALLGRQKGMHIATLLDTQYADRQYIEDLYKEKLIKKSNVFTYSNFTGGKEADVEDMFSHAFYVDLVNAEFVKQFQNPIDVAKLNSSIPRIVLQIEKYLDDNPMKDGKYSHFRPARYFSENAKKLSRKIPRETKERFEKAFKAVNALLPSV